METKKIKIEFNEEELKIFRKAIYEYEKNNYTSKDKKWQKTINRLIDKIR